MCALNIELLCLLYLENDIYNLFFQISLSLSIWKLVFWYKVPCEDGLGSCEYHDICATAARFSGEDVCDGRNDTVSV